MNADCACPTTAYTDRKFAASHAHYARLGTHPLR
jgi:hypothetical protein